MIKESSDIIMYRLILFIFLFFIENPLSFSQNIKRILSSEELIKLEKEHNLIKFIDSTNRADFEGFTGFLDIKQTKSGLKANKVGTWKRKNFGKVSDAVMINDSVGNLLSYKELNSKGIVEFDCQYNYDNIQGIKYRMEKMRINFPDGKIMISGNRCWKVTTDKYGINSIGKTHKFGRWEYFDNNGNIIKFKEYGEIK